MVDKPQCFELTNGIEIYTKLIVNRRMHIEHKRSNITVYYPNKPAEICEKFCVTFFQICYHIDRFT